MRLPWDQRITKSLRFLRGLWILRHFDTKGLVDAGARVKIVKQNGTIHIGRYCRIGEDVHIAVVGKAPAQKAVLRIGFSVGLSDRTKINVTESVIIGDHCSIGWDVDIADSAWHQVLIPDQEPSPLSQPIVIENNVWLGAHVIVLKGVTIGANSVISAGAVVATNIPPYSLAGGNPARVIRKIDGWRRDPDA
jgi:maltose O-acetyltransferase